MKAKEFLHNLSLYDGSNDHLKNSHAIYKTSQLMEMYAEAQQKEIEQLKGDKADLKYDFRTQGDETLLIMAENENLKEEIRMLKQYAEIAKNDKKHRKGLLNKALEEIKQLKTK